MREEDWQENFCMSPVSLFILVDEICICSDTCGQDLKMNWLLNCCSLEKCLRSP